LEKRNFSRTEIKIRKTELMLNGAKKTTFDIARISTPEVTFQNSNSDNFTSSNFLLLNFRHKSRRFRHFFPPPFSSNTQSSHFPSIRHTHTYAVVSKNVFFFSSLYAPPSFFFLPLQATKTTYTIFSFPNEILHKLTSCHFTLRNKTLNDLCLKILPFSLLRTKLNNSLENNNSNT